MRQHGLQFPAGPGSLCILFQTYIFQKCVAMADNFNLTCYFFLTLQYGWLRSRGSTHRSYWRAGGTITFSFLPFHFACPKFIQDAGCKTTSHPSFSECCCVEQETLLRKFKCINVNVCSDPLQVGKLVRDHLRTAAPWQDPSLPLAMSAEMQSEPIHDHPSFLPFSLQWWLPSIQCHTVSAHRSVTIAR